jgi:hypothetical protein
MRGFCFHIFAQRVEREYMSPPPPPLLAGVCDPADRLGLRRRQRRDDARRVSGPPSGLAHQRPGWHTSGLGACASSGENPCASVSTPMGRGGAGGAPSPTGPGQVCVGGGRVVCGRGAARREGRPASHGPSDHFHNHAAPIASLWRIT